MEVGEVIQGGGLVIGGGLLVKLLDWAKTAWAARNQRTEIAPTPLPVEETDKFITRGECKRLMCAHDTQLSEIRNDIKTGNVNILHKLEAMDRKSEERAIAAHSRIEPLVREISKNIGQVEMMKEAFLKSVVGGKK